MATTYVDEAVEVSCPEIVQHRGFVQVGHVGHVVAHLELGRVHLLHMILLEGLNLQRQGQALYSFFGGKGNDII